MAQEEGCHSGGSAGGCRPKKTKQKKAPQRGLGVAQLEKIILEEKQKKGYLGNIIDTDTGAAAAAGGTFLALHPNNFRPISICPSSIHNSDISETGLRQEHEVWPKFWNNNNNNNNNNSGSISHNLIAFEPQNGPFLPHRSHQFQRPSSPLVKQSSGISTVMSMSMSTQMEPPSIPSVHFKNYVFTEEDKMVGIMKKRPYPFSLDHSQSKSDEFASFTNDHFTNDQRQYNLHMEPRNKLIRESVPKLDPSETNLSEMPTNSGRINGDFLTLAPPSVASPPLKLVHKPAMDYLGLNELSNSDNQSIPDQEYDNNSQIDRAGPSGSVRSSFNFFPIKLLTNQNTAYLSSGNGEKGETIDLNLKL